MEHKGTRGTKSRVSKNSCLEKILLFRVLHRRLEMEGKFKGKKKDKYGMKNTLWRKVRMYS